MATDKFIDDVDPAHRDRLQRLGVTQADLDAATPLPPLGDSRRGTTYDPIAPLDSRMVFPNRPLIDDKVRVFDDSEVARLAKQARRNVEERQAARLAARAQRKERIAGFNAMLAAPYGNRVQTPAEGYSQGADVWPPIEPCALDEAQAVSRANRTPPHVTIMEIPLTVSEQRAIIEAQLCEPVFRMWMSPEEFDRVRESTIDWIYKPLSDGRIAIWRRRSDLDAILTKNTQLWSAICQRILEDDVI